MLSRASMITRYPQNSIVYEFIVEVFFDRVGIFLDECILRVTCPNGKLVLSKFTFQHCMCHLGYDQYFDPHKHIVISQAITVFMGAFLWKFSRTSITQIMACQRIQWFGTLGKDFVSFFYLCNEIQVILDHWSLFTLSTLSYDKLCWSH